MVDNVVKRHLSSTANASSGRTFIGLFLSHMEEVTDPHSSFYEDVGRKNLFSTLHDLITAGADTTTATLEFAVLFLAHHPQVQVEMQEELDSVIGSRLPCLSDKLPYTEAVILEVLRLASNLPIGFPHRALKDFDFHGYTIPKDTLLFGDYYNIHHDPGTFQNPNQFLPERFLSADKTKVVRPEGLMPFSIGRRNCVGESFAKATLLLLLASIFQQFKVELDQGGVLDLDDVLPGFILKPKPFKANFKRRNP